MDQYQYGEGPAGRRSPPPIHTRNYEGRHGDYRDYERSYDSGRDYHEKSARHRSRSRSPHRQWYQDDHRRNRRDYEHHYDRRDDYRYEHRRQDPRDNGAYLDYEEPAQEDIVDANNGDNDISLDDDNGNKKWILIRNLANSVNEQVLAKGLEKLYISDDLKGGAAAGSLKRLCIIRDRQTEKSAGFGFAEYATAKDANAAVSKAAELRDKCTVGSRQMMVDFPHNGVFPPALKRVDERFVIYMRTPGQAHQYRDERYFASEFVVTPSDEGNPNESSTAEVPTKTAEKPTKKRKPQTVTAPAIMNHWQKKQEELRSEQERIEQEKIDNRNGPPVSGVNAAPVAPTGYSEQTFCVDSVKLRCCYLCNAKFNSSEHVQKHLRESEKHAGYLKDTSAVAAGFDRLNKKNVSPDDTIKMLGVQRSIATVENDAPEQSDSQYRDRAAERRRDQFQSGTAEKVSFALGTQKTNKNPATPPSSSDTDIPKKPTYGKGLNMLQKAGWTEGKALGAGSTTMGVTGPIEQSLYASGVGLGHESSRTGDAVAEAQRMTTGDRSGFVEKTKENARMRFERISD